VAKKVERRTVHQARDEGFGWRKVIFLPPRHARERGCGEPDAQVAILRLLQDESSTAQAHRIGQRDVSLTYASSACQFAGCGMRKR